MRNYYENTVSYNKQDVINFLDKTSNIGVGMIGKTRKNVLLMNLGTGVSTLSKTFKIILDDKITELYQTYNEYADPWYTVTPAR